MTDFNYKRLEDLIESTWRGKDEKKCLWWQGEWWSWARFAALTADGSQQGASPREEGKMMTADEAARRIVRAVAKRKRTLLMDFDGKATRILKFFAPGLLDKLYYSHMAKEPDSPFK